MAVTQTVFSKKLSEIGFAERVGERVTDQAKGRFRHEFRGLRFFYDNVHFIFLRAKTIYCKYDDQTREKCDNNG